jgi:hypothetical protein
MVHFGSKLFQPEWRYHSLDMDERFTITPADLFGKANYTGGDFIILVTYQPWFIPFDREKRFRFRTHRQTNGNLYWYSVPEK